MYICNKQMYIFIWLIICITIHMIILLHSCASKFEVMYISIPNMFLLAWNGSHRLAYWFTSPFLHFILVICFIFKGLSSVNFLLHVANWFYPQKTYLALTRVWRQVLNLKNETFTNKWQNQKQRKVGKGSSPL